MAIDPKDFESIGASTIPLLVVLSSDGTIAAMGGSHAMDIEREVAQLMAKQN